MKNKPIINVAFTRFSQFVIKNFLLNPMKYKEHSLHLSFEQSSDVIFVGLNLYLWSRRFECSFFFNQSLLDSGHLLCCFLRRLPEPNICTAFQSSYDSTLFCLLSWLHSTCVDDHTFPFIYDQLCLISVFSFDYNFLIFIHYYL